MRIKKKSGISGKQRFIGGEQRFFYSPFSKRAQVTEKGAGDILSLYSCNGRRKYTLFLPLARFFLFTLHPRSLSCTLSLLLSLSLFIFPPGGCTLSWMPRHARSLSPFLLPSLSLAFSRALSPSLPSTCEHARALFHSHTFNSSTLYGYLG